MIGNPARNMKAGVAIIAVQCYRAIILGFLDGEVCVMMDAGKYRSARQRVKPRIRVAAWDVNAFLRLTINVPFDRDAMGGIFGSDTPRKREEARPDAFETNEADAADGVAVCEFRAKRWWQNSSYHIGIDVKVGEYASVNDASDYWNSHDIIFGA